MATEVVGWRNRNSYRYILGLDGPLLAWEYLRRNPSYQADWHAHDADVRPSSDRGWGLPRPD
jgi:hypothetical protein